MTAPPVRKVNEPKPAIAQETPPLRQIRAARSLREQIPVIDRSSALRTRADEPAPITQPALSTPPALEFVPLSALVITKQRTPRYPRLVRNKSASTNITFTVDERGRVSDVKSDNSASRAFERAAVRAIQQWRFEPHLRDGLPTSVATAVKVTFKP